MSELIPAEYLKRMRGCVGFEFPPEEMLRLFGHIDHLTERVKVLETALKRLLDARGPTPARRSMWTEAELAALPMIAGYLDAVEQAEKVLEGT